MRGLLPLVLAACTPVLDDPTPYVDEPRLLAVQADPPEASAGATVRLTAWAADPDAGWVAAGVSWGRCDTPRPLAELGPVAPACQSADGVTGLGEGDGIDAVVLAEACSLFGPNPPPPVAGQPSGRPVDPDVTGGFYQPFTAFSDLGDLLAPLRLRCGIANVTQDTSIRWNRGYRDNTRPRIETITVSAGEDEQVAADGAVVLVPAGEVVVTVGWPACGEDGVCGDGVCGGEELADTCPDDCAAPVACGGAESYIVHTTGTEDFVVRRERLSATWYTSGAEVEPARSGREGSDPARDAATTVTVGSGRTWVGVVLRDERGGVERAGIWLEAE